MTKQELHALCDDIALRWIGAPVSRDAYREHMSEWLRTKLEPLLELPAPPLPPPRPWWWWWRRRGKRG